MIFVTILTGIWYLHRHPHLLLRPLIQLKLAVFGCLLYSDHLFRHAVLPEYPESQPQYGNPAKALAICGIAFIVLSVV